MQIEEMNLKGNMKTSMQIEGTNCDFVDLDMYNIPPIEYYSYSGLSNVCQQRIELYKELERFREDRNSNEEKRDYYACISDILKKSQAKFATNKLDDLISHWVLKLTFNLNDQSAFIIYEGTIFRGRLYEQAIRYASSRIEGSTDEERTKSQKEWMNKFYFEKLRQYIQGDNPEKKAESTIRIPFKFAASLIETYKVELDRGYAIITPENAFKVIQELYNEILHHQNKNVERIYKQIVKQDQRLEKLIELLREYNKSTEHYYKPEKTITTSKIEAGNIEYLAKEYFPLCMSEILEGLKTKHQLKHWGRLQLGLFLKGIGMKLEDNILLFGNHLSKLPDASKKISEYKYYIEHMYGKRGKKTDYTPWSCQKVADKAIPSNNDVYGCPFKFYSDAHLAKALRMRKLDDGQINEVISARKVNYNIGCRKMFELTHNVNKVFQGVGKHPNSYYLSSYFNKNRKEQTSFNNLTA